MSTIALRKAACFALLTALLAGASALPAKADSPASSSPQTAAESSTQAALAAPQPEYVRIQVSPKRSIYLEFHGNEMRMASTVPGLETAKPVRARKATPASGPAGFVSSSFPEVDLPVPAAQLPRGFAKARARFVYERYSPDTEEEAEMSSYVTADIGFAHRDHKRGQWVYWISQFVEPKDAPVSAPKIGLPPSLAGVKLELTTKVSENRSVGIAAVARSAAARFADITRNGKSVLLNVTVLDRGKKVVKSEKGPLGKYGFG